MLGQSDHDKWRYVIMTGMSVCNAGQELCGDQNDRCPEQC